MYYHNLCWLILSTEKIKWLVFFHCTIIITFFQYTIFRHCKCTEQVKRNCRTIYVWEKYKLLFNLSLIKLNVAFHSLVVLSCKRVPKANHYFRRESEGATWWRLTWEGGCVCSECSSDSSVLYVCSSIPWSCSSGYALSSPVNRAHSSCLLSGTPGVQATSDRIHFRFIIAASYMSPIFFFLISSCLY